MGEVVVAVLNRPREAETLLDAGARLLEILGGGRLKALTVRMPPIATILPSEEVLTARREASIRAEQEDWAGQLRAVVDNWSDRSRAQGIQTDWVDIEGDAAKIIIAHGRRADTIVVRRPAAHESDRMRHGMHAALFDTECPVLVVPPGFASSLGQVVAIAWKDDERALKAVRASIPILAKAQSVHVLCADADAGIPPVLLEHDIKPHLHVVPEDAASVGERLLHAAHQVGADLLVMGAFAHREWREFLFGGVTRYMLAATDLPLFMRH